MIHRFKALALLLLCWPLYSHSDPYIYGVTTNAASAGLNWSMANVLPQQSGLEVSNVIYQYTAIKDPADDMLVHVQNENASGEGYIFRETDDWSGLEGNTINKIVAVNNIPISAWGRGSIEVEGQGMVADPNVIYTYKYDPCHNPQADPSCEGYQPPIPPPEPVDYDIYDALSDSAVVDATAETDPELYDRDNKKRQQIQQESDPRLEQALAASENALSIASEVSQDFMIDAVRNDQRLIPYFQRDIVGRTYTDVLTLPKTDIPDNKKGLRNNLAQQLLHEQMIKSQYE